MLALRGRCRIHISPVSTSKGRRDKVYVIMIKNWTTLGVVLKRTNLGEADRLLTIYTEKFGKISAIAKSARKPKSSFVSHLEPGTIIQFELAHGKTFYIITGAKTIKHYDFSELPKMRALFHWLELTDKITALHAPQTQLFDQISDGIKACSERSDHAYLHELGLFSTTGFKLELKVCVAGREPLKESSNGFSARLGGLVCVNHSEKAKDFVKISASSIKIMRLAQSHDWDTLEKIVVPDTVTGEARNIVRLCRYEIIEQELKSDQM